MTEHRHFHDELAQLKERVLHMSGRAEEAVGKAVRAFLEHDAAAARTVMHGDGEIDGLEIEIDNRITNLLALHQPVAKDLRLLLAALKISNDLERVGDHAVNIAQSARTLTKHGAPKPLPELEEMATRVRGMLGDALTAFVKGDAKAGREVCLQDDRVDDLHREVFRRMVTGMTEGTEDIEAAMEFMRVSRNLERVADLATNVAEDVVFLVEGTTIKHGAEGSRE